MIIVIFYCGLVVHITDTRAQRVVSYASAHITETVFAHDQHWEEQSCLSSSQLYRHSQKHRKWINHTAGHYTTGVSTCPALRGAKHFPSTSYFLYRVGSLFNAHQCHSNYTRAWMLNNVKDHFPIVVKAYSKTWQLNWGLNSTLIEN